MLINLSIEDEFQTYQRDITIISVMLFLRALFTQKISSHYIQRIVRFYIYIIYTPNLGLGIAVSVREREHSRFRGSIEGARGSIEGARGSNEGARGSNEGARGSSEGARGSSKGACMEEAVLAPHTRRGAAQRSLNWLHRTRL